MKLQKLPKLKMNVQSYKTMGTREGWKYTGRCGLHIPRPLGRKSPYYTVIILPHLELRRLWVKQFDLLTQREYLSLNFGWIIWQAEFYFRVRKSRPAVEL